MFEKYFRAYQPFFLIIMILLAAIGISSFLTMSKESMPEVNLPFFNITATYPGADAETVEQQVITKIENKLPSVKNINTYNSVSSNNVGVINLEFQRGSDKGTAYTDLKSAVDEVKASLPSGVDAVVTKTDPKDVPIYTFSITGPHYPSLLYDKVRYLEDDLKKLPGVDKVVVSGRYISQVEVEFDYEALKSYNLKLSSLVGLVSQNISQQQVDKKRMEGNLYTFEVCTYAKDGGTLQKNLAGFQSFLENVTLINQGGNVLRLRDVAKVTVSHPFYQRLSYVNGNNAISYMVYKVPGSDILKVIEEVKKYLDTQDPIFTKEGITHAEMSSQEISISTTFNAFIAGFRDTSILILIIVTIFLGLRWSLAVAITFSFVYLLTFIVTKSMGYTFNTIVSASLNLSLGIMVDNLIVIAQWAQDGLRKGYGKYRAIQHSLQIYWKSLLIGNLVTISMFLPIGFVLTGKMGEFIKFLPVTVNLTLVLSIIVAFIFLPLTLSYMDLKPQKGHHEAGGLEKFFLRFEHWFEKIYRNILKNPKFYASFFYVIFIVVILAFAKFGKTDFMPMTDKDNIYINIRYNKDTKLEQNQKLTEKIYSHVKEYFGQEHQGIIKNIELNLGLLYSQSALDNTVYRTSFNPELAELNIVLKSTEERDAKDSAVIIFPKLNAFLESKIKADPELGEKVTDLTVFIQKNGPSGGKDVTFNISASGSTDSEIKLLADEYEKILPQLKSIPGTYGWSSTLEYTNGKINIIYDTDKLSQVWLTATELNLMMFGLNQTSTGNYLTNYKGIGIPIASLNDFWKDIIPVKWYLNYASQVAGTIDFRELMVPGTNVYMNDLIKSIKVLPQIKSFQHADGDLILKVEANKSPETVLSDVTKKINTIVSKSDRLQMAYGADVKDSAQASKDMGFAFLIGFVLMFAILVLNFENFTQPFILMLTMPLFLTGALLFLLLSGETMSFMVDIGFFGLIGVWLAHIIYLINRFNELLHDHKGHGNIDEIILESVKSRLEPVFLTTIITALWLFVLAFQDEFWRAFALSFAGWLLVGTTITLVFVPSALKIAYQRRLKKIEQEDQEIMSHAE